MKTTNRDEINAFLGLHVIAGIFAGFAKQLTLEHCDQINAAFHPLRFRPKVRFEEIPSISIRQKLHCIPFGTTEKH